MNRSGEEARRCVSHNAAARATVASSVTVRPAMTQADTRAEPHVPQRYRSPVGTPDRLARERLCALWRWDAQRDLTPASLSERLAAWLATPDLLAQAAGAARRLGRPDAATWLADLVEALIGQEART